MILRFRYNFRLRRGGETAIPDKFQPEASQSGIRDVAVRGLQGRKTRESAHGTRMFRKPLSASGRKSLNPHNRNLKALAFRKELFFNALSRTKGNPGDWKKTMSGPLGSGAARARYSTPSRTPDGPIYGGEPTNGLCHSTAHGPDSSRRKESRPSGLPHPSLLLQRHARQDR